MRLAATSIGLVLCLAAGWLIWGYKQSANAAAGPRISALGGTWEIKDMHWHDFAGAWRVSGDIVPVRVTNLRIGGQDLIRGLCGAVLTALPGKPDGLGGREDIFRVDLNVAKDDKVTMLFPQRLPVAVSDGACLNTEVKDLYFPTYPGNLSSWYMASSGFQKTKNDVLRTIIFRPRAGRDASLSHFPFHTACEAVAADEIARRPVSQGAMEIPALEDGKITITAQSGGIVGRFISETFVLSGEKCEAPA